jgi:hypothetical protein
MFTSYAIDIVQEAFTDDINNPKTKRTLTVEIQEPTVQDIILLEQFSILQEYIKRLTHACEKE